jgi:hypothetical protein
MQEWNAKPAENLTASEFPTLHKFVHPSDVNIHACLPTADKRPLPMMQTE